MKHTPGPWKITNGQYPNGYFIQTIVTDEESMANAKLIAAAPELLEALQKVNHAIQSSNMKGTILHEEIRSAIKKATT